MADDLTTEKKSKFFEKSTFTTGAVCNPPVTLESIQKAIDSLSEPPRVLAMNFPILFSDVLPPNTIIMSTDLAEALGLKPLAEKKSQNRIIKNVEFQQQ